MKDSQSYHMKRSFKFICLQNSNRHIEKVSTQKHYINDKFDPQSPAYKQMSPEKEVGSEHKMNLKRIKEIDRNIRNENAKLLCKLHEIMDTKGKSPISNQCKQRNKKLSETFLAKRNDKKEIFNTNSSFAVMMSQAGSLPRSHTPQNSTRNNQNMSSFITSFKRQSEQSSIERENYIIAKKIVECKPSVGTISEWDDHYERFQKNCSIRRLTPSTVSIPSSVKNKKKEQKIQYKQDGSSFNKTYQGFEKNNIFFNTQHLGLEKLFSITSSPAVTTKNQTRAESREVESTGSEFYQQYKDSEPRSFSTTQKKTKRSRILSSEQNQNILPSGQINEIENNSSANINEQQYQLFNTPKSTKYWQQTPKSIYQQMRNMSYYRFDPENAMKLRIFRRGQSFTSPHNKLNLNFSSQEKLLNNTTTSQFQQFQQGENSSQKELSPNENNESCLDPEVKANELETRQPKIVEARNREFEKLKALPLMNGHLIDQQVGIQRKKFKKQKKQRAGKNSLLNQANYQYDTNTMLIKQYEPQESSDSSQQRQINSYNLKIQDIQDKYINLELLKKDTTSSQLPQNPNQNLQTIPQQGEQLNQS